MLKQRKKVLKELPLLLKYNTELFQIVEQDVTHVKLASCSKKSNHECCIKRDPKSASSNVIVFDTNKFFEGKLANVVDGEVKCVTYNIVKQCRLFLFSETDFVRCTVDWFQCGIYFFSKRIFQLYMTCLIESPAKTSGRVRAKMIIDHKIALRDIVNEYNQHGKFKIKYNDKDIRDQIASVMPRIETFNKIGSFMFYEISWEYWKESCKIAIKMRLSGLSLDHTFDVVKNIYGKYQTLKQPTANFDKLCK